MKADPRLFETGVGIALRDGRGRFRWRALLIAVVATGMGLFHMAQSIWFLLPTQQVRALHLGLALLLILLSLIEESGSEFRIRRVALWACAALALLPLLYSQVEYQSMVTTRPFGPNDWDTYIGVLFLLLVFGTALITWGYVIPILGIVALLYGYFGASLPGNLLYHGGLDFDRLIGYTSFPFFRGMLGSLTQISASIVFQFMLFAGALQATGGLRFILRVAFAVTGRAQSGPALVAVSSSSVMGMLSGSTVANIASTGAITIPLMRRGGYSREFAGAVEAVASNGGQILPPVMGVTAFLIVGMADVSYTTVVWASLFPAIIYFIYVAAAVQLRAGKIGLKPDPELAHDHEGVPLRRDILANLHLVAAVGILVYFLVIQFPASWAAVSATAVLLGADIIKRVLADWRRPWLGVLRGCETVARAMVLGARNGATVAVVVAVINVFVEMLSSTGFELRLSGMILDLAGGSLWLLLLLVAVTCLAFGLGMPTSAAYIIVALLAAPALIQLGVNKLSAHLFVFYLANMSSLTPPVAVGALVAANIAGGHFMRTAFLAVRLGIPGFLLPFLFIISPALIGIDASLAEHLAAAAFALAGLLAVNSALEGRFLRDMTRPERVLALLAAALLFWPGWIYPLIGAAILFAGMLFHVVRRGGHGDT